MPNRVSVARIVQQLPRAQVYLIAGPTGSGKTTLARTIALLSEAVVLPMDDYFLNEEQVELAHSEEYGQAHQWDSPSACDFDLLVRNTLQLVNEGQTRAPAFSFFENRRIGYRVVRRESNQPVVIEGLHAITCKEALENSGISVFSIFVTANEQVRSERSRSRDLKERGRPESLFERRFHFIRMAEEQWIMEQRQMADLVVDTSGGFADEPKDRKD